MNVNRQSPLFSEITPGKLAAIVARHLPMRELLSAELLSGGLFNTIYLLTFYGGERIVLRAAPERHELLLPYEHNLMHAEVLATKRFLERGIPAPRIYAVEDDMMLLPRTYMLTEYIPGAPLHNMNISATAKNTCYVEAGRYIRQIHDIAGTEYGRLAQICTGGGFFTWREAILNEVATLKRCSAPYRLFEPVEYAMIDEVFALNSSTLDEIIEPRLAHGDLWEGNLLVDGSGERYNLTAIIDADRALFGDPDFDFPSGWMMNEAFSHGYNRELSQHRNAVIRRKLYSLIYSITNCYVWKCQHMNPSESLPHYRSVRRLLKELARPDLIV